MEQSTTQVPPQVWWQFKKGQSGNPSGMTNARRRTAELVAEFAAVHGRQPTNSERMRIRGAANLAAKLESDRRRSQDPSRDQNALDRALSRLGLSTKPVRATPASYPAGRVLMKDRADE